MNSLYRLATSISDPTITMIDAISRLSASLLTEPIKKQLACKMFVEALSAARRPRPTAHHRGIGPPR